MVAPDYTTPGPGSLFANSSTAGRFEDYTLNEVIPFIDANYRTLARAESRAITGDFMGAYGALRYAFRHPDVFSVVYGMHPVGTGSGVEPLFQRPDWALLQSARTPAELQRDFYAPGVPGNDPDFPAQPRAPSVLLRLHGGRARR